jgi:hypothetical protein
MFDCSMAGSLVEDAVAMPPCPEKHSGLHLAMKAASGRPSPLGKGLACTLGVPVWPGPKPVLTVTPRAAKPAAGSYSPLEGPGFRRDAIPL